MSCCHTRVRSCRAPIALQWTGLDKVELEIRLADLDYKHSFEQITGTRVTLTVKGRETGNIPEVVLAGVGRYRIRLHADKRPKRAFADSLHEWWLHVE
jgi:hypothetical protein